MHSHIAILDSKNRPLTLQPDTNINITDKNPMFNDVEMFSQPIPLPFEQNRHLLGNMDDRDSTARANDIRGERFRILVDGLPLRNTAIKVQEGTLLNDTIDVNFDATNRTFKDMISDMRCRDVTVDNNILIGEKIGDVEVKMHIVESVTANFTFGEGWAKIILPTKHLTETFQPPALGFSFPGECYQDGNMEAEPDPDAKKATRTYPNCNKAEDSTGGNITVKVPHVKTSYINVSEPYPAKPYCNTRICYAHHAAEKDNDGKWTGETSDEIIKAKDRDKAISEDMSPYWVLDADRPASGICFYVAYFLERLFKTLVVTYDMRVLTDIEDFNYLAFFNTGCHFDTGESVGTFTGDLTYVNKWLESRGCGGSIDITNTKPKGICPYYTDPTYRRLKYEKDEYVDVQYYFAKPNYGTVDIRNDDGSIDIYSDWVKYAAGTGHPYDFFGDDFTERNFDVTCDVSAKVLRMYANADNFPDANVSEVIESLENLFGVRFCYDAEINKVTVRLLRDMFRSTEAPIPFKGEVLSMVKKTENIRGIRYGYSAEQDAREQRDNIRYQKRDYETSYNYMDYPQGRTQLAPYVDLTTKIDVGNRNGYCDLQTGDFFRIKVSADASTTDELQPAIFEVGQYKGVELGDCSADADLDDAIKDIRSGFEPVMVNDVAYRGKNFQGDQTPMLVPFIDEDMEHEFLIKKLLNPVSTAWGSIDIVYRLCLAECYDPTSTDDGQSPLMSHDWGMTIGFMRPSRNGGGVYEYEPGYDGFGNSKWGVLSSDYAFTADTMDVFGNFYGTSAAGSFSLKPRAYKPFRYKYDEGGTLLISTKPQEWDDTWLIPCNADERNAQGIITRRIRSRGTCDTWMIDFFHFLLNRQCYEVKALCTAAELADIPNKWLRRWEIDGKIGWINILEYPASVENGIGEVKMEFFSL